MKRTPPDIGARLDRLLSRHRTPSPDRMQAAINRVGRQIGSAEIPLSRPAVKSTGPSRAWLAAAATLAVVTMVGLAMLWPERSTPLHSVLDSVLEGTVHEGDTLWTNGGNAQLALTDGSRVEMRSQSEIALQRAMDGIRIRLDRGGIIVNAAKQRTGHLYVQTKDMTVSVVGTVFVVNADNTGSRVAVIEGEVRVQQGATETKLRPGERVASPPNIEAFTVASELAWSRRAAALVALLEQSTAVSSLPAPAPQAPAVKREAFEVVSIRIGSPAPSGGGRGRPANGACDGRIQIDPSRVAITGATLNYLITMAYGYSSPFGGVVLGCAGMLDKKRLSGGPDWAGSDRFDIEAGIPDGPLPYVTTAVASRNGTAVQPGTPLTVTARDPSPRFLELLRTLLEERFKLSVRREQRGFPVYLLTVAPSGPKLTTWKEGEPLGSSSVTRNGSYQAYKNGIAPPKPYGDLHVGHISARKGSMAILANQLSVFTPDRIVLDRTGLTGEFNYELFFVPYGPVPDGKFGLTRPTLAGALAEELGLELKPSTEPIEFLVIERVERPTEN